MITVINNTKNAFAFGRLFTLAPGANKVDPGSWSIVAPLPGVKKLLRRGDLRVEGAEKSEGFASGEAKEPKKKTPGDRFSGSTAFAAPADEEEPKKNDEKAASGPLPGPRRGDRGASRPSVKGKGKRGKKGRS